MKSVPKKFLLFQERSYINESFEYIIYTFVIFK